MTLWSGKKKKERLKDKHHGGMSREEHSLETRKATLSPCSTGVLCLSLWTPDCCGPAGESSKKNGKSSQQSGKERLKELGSSD